MRDAILICLGVVLGFPLSYLAWRWYFSRLLIHVDLMLRSDTRRYSICMYVPMDGKQGASVSTNLKKLKSVDIEVEVKDFGKNEILWYATRYNDK